jgi:conjugal transfer ATP-binding protein TraC
MAAFHQLMPVYAMEGHKLIFKDGRVALGFALEGVEAEQWTEAQYQQLNTLFAGALKPLPVGTVVQRLDFFYDQAYRNHQKDRAYFQGKADAYFMDRLMLFQQSYLFITLPADKMSRSGGSRSGGSRSGGSPNGYSRSGGSRSSPTNNLFVQLHRKIFENPLAYIGKRLEEGESLAMELTAALETAGGIRLKRLGDDALHKLYLQYFNLQFDTTPATFQRPIYNHHQSLAVGEKKLRVLSLMGQGSQVLDAVRNGCGVSVPMIYPLTQALQFPHILSQNILIEDTDACLRQLDREKKINSSLHFLATQDNLIKSAEIDAFTAEVRGNNRQLVSLNLSLLLFEPDDKRLQQYLEKAVTAFRQVGGCECLVESYDAASLFFANAPGNAAQNYRWLLMPAYYAVTFAHFTTNYRSCGEGELLCDRYRNPLRVNLFNTRLNNQNCLVIGPSGSGKSYTMGNFICQRFERGDRQIIIDVGGTYKNVIESLVGLEAYFEYDLASPLSFNPFLIDRQAGRWTLSGDKLNFLTALLAILRKGAGGTYAQGGKALLSPAERAILVRLIPAYYDFLNGEKQRQTLPSLAGFYHWFRCYHRTHAEQEEYRTEMQFFNVAQFLVVLRPFVEGEYRRVLNASRELDISDLPLVCFDMARIKSDPGLYPVISMLITELALDQVRKFPNDRKYLYMDEAWAMLSDAMGEWVESMYRTIRKNNGAMCIITQGIDEIIGSPVGAAIIQNAQTQIILNHTDGSQVKKLSLHLGFTSHEVDKIHSLRIGKNYRELFIKQGDTAKVYCLEVSPYMDAVLSSKPVERNYLRKLMAQFGGSIHHAVNQYVEDRQLKKGVFYE